MSRALVLITGTGRSGTSTMSGALHHLGLSVPGPYLGANKSNPKGFFESRWAVDFHKEIAAAAGIADFDSRPWALDLVQDAVTPARRRRLVEFLRGCAAEADQVVVKDPRSVWVQRLWKEAAAEAGLQIRYVSMLRHPAEVVGSRATYYASRADEDRRRAYETVSVARWVNNSLISERQTRGEPRAFVRYLDLLEDWRPVLRRLRGELGLEYDFDSAPPGEHPVDAFIDPGLRRHQVTWADLDVPAQLQDLAQDVWDGLAALHGLGDGTTDGTTDVHAELDRLAVRYRTLLDQAVAVSHDVIDEARNKARRDALAETATPARRPRRPAALRDRRVRDVAGRDLLREAGRRAVAKLRRA